MIFALILLFIKFDACFGQEDNVSNGESMGEYSFPLFQMSRSKIALVTGYTGESGKALVKELVTKNQFEKIILVGRRRVDFNESGYKEKTVV